MQYLDEKQMIEERLAWIDVTLKRHMKRGGPGEMHTDESYIDADAIRAPHRQPVEDYLITWQKLNAERNELTERLAKLNQRIAAIQAYLDKEPDSKERVRFIKMYLCKDMPLKQVAELACISYDRCRHIWAELKKEDSTKNSTDSIAKP